MTEATHSLADLPPAAENAQPEFVADVLAETRLFLQLVEQVRWAAKNGEPGDAADAAKALKEQAHRMSEKANANANANKDKEKDNPGRGNE